MFSNCFDASVQLVQNIVFLLQNLCLLSNLFSLGSFYNQIVVLGESMVKYVKKVSTMKSQSHL